MKKYVLLLLLCFGIKVQAQVSYTAIVPITPTTVGRYQKFEVGVALNKTDFINQFDPNEIDVYAIFTNLSSGRQQRVNAFWFQDFDRNESTPDPTDNDPCDINAVGVPDPNYLTTKTTALPWRIRFAPDAVGAYRYQVYVKYTGQSTIMVSAGLDLTATTSAKPGYIGVGSNKTHFVYQNTSYPNESVFVPLGINIMDKGSIVFNRAAFKYQKSLMGKLASANGNTIRIFMSPENYGIEWNEDGIGKYLSRQNRAFNLDELFNLADSLGIKIQLITSSNHEFHNADDGAQAGYNYWLNNPYRTFLGPVSPVLKNQYSYFNNPTCIDLYKRRMRYIIARWGYSTALLAYELWNEVGIMVNAQPTIWTDNNIQIVENWHNTIVNYAKTLDARHMFTSSSGGPGFFNFGNTALDYTQDHYYSNDMNVLYNYNVFAQYGIKAYNKPYICGEIGGQDCWLGCENFTHSSFTPGNYAHDMMEFHNAIWSSLFSGSAAPAYTWDSKNLFNNCWGGAYKSFKPLFAFINNDNFFSKSLSYISTVPTGPKGPKDSYKYGYGNNSIPTWVYYPDNNAPANPLSAYITRGITTSDDSKIDVFAAKSEDRVQGWVHNRSNYWYNLPHSSGDPNVFPCNTFNDNQPSTPANIPTLSQKSFTISNVGCDGLYKVDFYSTYPQYDINGDNVKDDGGMIVPFSQSYLQAYCGNLTVPIPTLAPISNTGGPYAPDYGFKITKLSDYWSHALVIGGLSQISRLSAYNSNKMYYSDYNGAIRYVALNTSTNTFQQAIISPAAPNQSEKAIGPICVNESNQVFYKGYDNKLQCYFLGNGVWNHGWFTDWTSNSQNVGNYIVSGPGNIFFQGQDAKVHRYNFSTLTNTWVHSVLPHGTDPNTNVLGAMGVEQSSNNVFYRGADNRLQCFYLSGGTWNHIWLTDWANNTQNVGGDVKVGEAEIYYAGTDGYLHKYYYSNGWNHGYIVDGSNNRILCPSGSSISIIGNGDQIFFQGADGQMQHLYGKQGLRYSRDQVICGNDLQLSYRGNGITANDNQEAIYYVGLDNMLHLYAFDNGCTPRAQLSMLAAVQPANEYHPVAQQAVSELQLAKDEQVISVFPNPFAKYLNIKFAAGQADEIKLIDLVGRVLYQARIGEASREATIDTDQVPGGVYMIMVFKNGKAVYKAKAVKQ